MKIERRRVPSISGSLIAKTRFCTSGQGEGSPSVQVGVQKIANLALPSIWLVRCAVLAIVALQFLVVNDLTLLPRWIMPSLELALLLPLSIATAWSIGATKKAAAADNPADFWEIVARHRNMPRRAFLFLTGLVSSIPPPWAAFSKSREV